MASAFADITGLAGLIDIEKSHVLNPLPILFLCGGKIPTDGSEPESLRGVLESLLTTQYADLRSKVVLAESAATWYRNTEHFENLVELEEHLAALSTVILLIVESAGSIAELGSFSFVDSIRDKLSVVIESNFTHFESFIMEGPIAKLGRSSDLEGSRYYAYDWLNEDQSRIDYALASAASERIVSNVLRPAVIETPKAQLFKKDNIGHQMLLLADFVSLAGPLLIGEIETFLKGCGLDLPRKVVHRYLYLLEKLHFLEKHHYGNYDFYVVKNSSLNFAAYASVTTKPFNADRFIFEVRKLQQASSSVLHHERMAVFAKTIGRGESK